MPLKYSLLLFISWFFLHFLSAERLVSSIYFSDGWEKLCQLWPLKSYRSTSTSMEQYRRMNWTSTFEWRATTQKKEFMPQVSMTWSLYLGSIITPQKWRMYALAESDGLVLERKGTQKRRKRQRNGKNANRTSTWAKCFRCLKMQYLFLFHILRKRTKKASEAEKMYRKYIEKKEKKWLVENNKICSRYTYGPIHCANHENNTETDLVTS